MWLSRADLPSTLTRCPVCAACLVETTLWYGISTQCGFQHGASTVDAGRLCEDQEFKDARDEFRHRIAGFTGNAADGAQSAHSTTHPEFVPMEFSSTHLV